MRLSPLFAAGAGLAISIVALAPAWGEEWKDRAEVRLIDGGVLGDGATRLAGIEIRLDPEWKTYWRHPGDSGIPPRMDFSASGNVAATTLEWPAPERHFDGYGWVIDYTDSVIFPVLVKPQDPAKPSELKLRLDYAVCKDICIPVEAKVAATLDGKKPRTAEIEYFRARVPEALEGPREDLGIVSAVVVGGAESPVLELHAKFPGGANDAFAVVEGPEGWYLPLPERADDSPDGAAVFRVPLDGAPDPTAVSGAEIRVTGVSPAYAFEQTLTLD